MPLIFDLSGRYVALSLERQTDYTPAISESGRTAPLARNLRIVSCYPSTGSNISYSTILERGNIGAIGYQMQLLSPGLYTTIQETEQNA